MTFAVAHCAPDARAQFRILPVVVVMGAFAFLLRTGSQVGWGSVLAECRRAGPCVALVFLAPAVGNALHMLGWRLLFPSDVRPRLWPAYRAFVVAQAGNELGLGVMGEPAKVAVIPRRERDVAIATLIIDNAAALVALLGFLLSLGGFLLAWFPHSLLPRRAELMAGVGLIVLAPFGFVIARGAQHRLSSKRRQGRRAPVSGGPSFVDRSWRTLAACRRLLSERPGSVGGAVVLHYLGKLWILAEMALVMRILGCGSMRGTVLLSLASACGSIVGAPVPGQLGVVESAMLSSAGAAGIPLAAALTIALLRRVRGGLWILLGTLMAPRCWSGHHEQGELRA